MFDNDTTADKVFDGLTLITFCSDDDICQLGFCALSMFCQLSWN